MQRFELRVAAFEPQANALALERLERSSILANYIPSRYLRVYAEVKRGEYGELIEQVFNREFDFYA